MDIVAVFRPCRRTAVALWLVLAAPGLSAQTPADGPAAAATPADGAADGQAPADAAAAAPSLPAALSVPQLLAGQLPDAEASWLQAEGGEFLVVERRPVDLTEKGTLVLVPAWGQHADWPDVIAAVARALPAHGWRTVVVDLTAPEDPAPAVPAPADPDPAADPAAAGPADPAAPDPAAPADGQQADATPDPDPGPGAASAAADTPPVDPLIAAAPIANARLRATVEAVRSRGTPMVVVAAYDSGARFAVDSLAGSGARGLAMISGRFNDDVLDSFGAALVPLGMPVLDIYADRDLGHVLRSARQRRAGARQEGVAFDQRRLDSTDHRYTGYGEELGDILRGWLERLRRG